MYGASFTHVIGYAAHAHKCESPIFLISPILIPIKDTALDTLRLLFRLLPTQKGPNMLATTKTTEFETGGKGNRKEVHRRHDFTLRVPSRYFRNAVSEEGAPSVHNVVYVKRNCPRFPLRGYLASSFSLFSFPPSRRFYFCRAFCGMLRSCSGKREKR